MTIYLVPKQKQSGLSIAELMVALAIGSLLIIGVAALFLGSRQSYQTNDAQSRLQENARFALEALAYDIRMGRYLGCLPFGEDGSPGRLYVIANPVAPKSFKKAPTVEGFVFPAPEVLNITDGVTGSSILTLRRLSEFQAPIQPLNPPTAAIRPTVSMQFQKGDYMIVSDCAKASLFRATNDDASGMMIEHAQELDPTGNSQADIGESYGSGATVGRFVETTYYVAQTSRRNERGEVVSALYRQVTGSSAPEELAEGVENMSIQFGFAGADGRLDQYVDAGTAGFEASNILSIRIELLVASAQGNVTDGAQQYVFRGITQTATDRKIRTVVSTTIALRNASELAQQ